MTPSSPMLSAAMIALMSSPALAGEVVISGFLTEGSTGVAEQCVRVSNMGTRAVDLSDWSLSGVLGPGAGAAGRRGKGGRNDLVFPPGTTLRAGEALTVARDGAAYRVLFGVAPDFEVGTQQNDPQITDMLHIGRGGEPWVMPNSEAGVLGLFYPPEQGGVPRVADAVVWDFSRDDLTHLDKELRTLERQQGLRKGALWRGAPLDPWGNLGSPFPPRGRVFVRDRDNAGVLVPDTDSWRDWDASASQTKLGRDAGHRVEMAGQSHFIPRPVEEEARFVLTSSPDNNFQGILDLWASARKEILVSAYYFRHPQMTEALVNAIHRGVDVFVYMEGGVVGVKSGIDDEERWAAQQIEMAGRERSGDAARGLGQAWWLISGDQLLDRYQFDHSKYTIVDRRAIAIGSENYGSTGHPVKNSYGNRGWEIQVHASLGHPTPSVINHLLEVWRDDLDPAHHADVVRYQDTPDRLDEQGRGRYGPPPRGFTAPQEVSEGIHRAAYARPVSTSSHRARMELVLSPDTSLHEESAILGAIGRAKEELLVQHLDMRLYWGSGRLKETDRSPTTTPNLLLAAIVEAARRGVRVRVQLDCSEHCYCGENAKVKDDSNPQTVRYLRDLAASEGLDLDAHLIDLSDQNGDRENQGFSRIHNKGLVIDGETVLVSSINGSENSFKGNREVGILVSSAEVARYYRELFWYDWTTILAPREVQGGKGSGVARKALSLSGLTPQRTYYFRVSAVDSDATDRDCTHPTRALGPHESAFSEELALRADARGAISLSWGAVTSEDREGDLAGYRVYFDDEPHPQIPTAADGASLYNARSREGSSPISVHP